MTINPDHMNSKSIAVGEGEIAQQLNNVEV